jgi:hypothetical protein
MYSFEALQILIFLIPGFISETILNMVLVRKDKNDLGKVIEALIFSLIIYVLFSLVVSRSPVSLTIVSEAKEGNSSTFTLTNNGVQYLWLLLFSVVLPLVIGFCVTNDLHMKLLRRLQITGKSSRDSIWLDLFINNKKSVIVNLTDGRRITGLPLYYSDDPSNQYLNIYNPAWIVYNEEKKIEEIVEMPETEGILVTPQQKIDSIMFIQDKGGHNDRKERAKQPK